MLGLVDGIDSGESGVNTKMQDLANIFTSYGEYIQDVFPGYFEAALNTVENLGSGLESNRWRAISDRLREGFGMF